MKVLVLGGDGFCGWPASLRLSESGHDVTIVDNFSRREIDAELARYPTRQAASVDAMKIVQRHRGWVSDESLKDLAAVLNMTADEVLESIRIGHEEVSPSQVCSRSRVQIF